MLLLPRVVSPEIAFAVLKAACSASGKVSHFDALCGENLVNITILIIITFLVYKLCPEYFVSSSSEHSEKVSLRMFVLKGQFGNLLLSQKCSHTSQ